MVAVFAAVGWIVVILAFLSCGRTQPVSMMLVGISGRQKASPRLRNVVCNRKLAYLCLFTFYVKGRWFSQRPYCPLTNRRKTGSKTEPFLESFWKILHVPQFVRLILLYGQNGQDRKNMAIMQNWPVLLRKIAKMQYAACWAFLIFMDNVECKIRPTPATNCRWRGDEAVPMLY